MTGDTWLYTGSWRSPIDAERYALISISRSAPRGRRGYRHYSRLRPGSWFGDPMPAAVWAERYEAEVLGVLDPQTVVDELKAIAGDRPGVLLCWEAAPPDQAWCHRGLVSRWLQGTLGLDVPEIGHEDRGCGCRHPKLPHIPKRRNLSPH